MAAVLTVNTGSSSVKLAVVAGSGPSPAAGELRASSDLGALGDPATVAAVQEFTGSCGPVDAVAHRVVHGGDRFVAPAVVDEAVRQEMHALCEVAPLHIPRALQGIDVIAGALGPQVPAVACFDTAFHAGLPAEAATYALPRAWSAQWGLRRYGFHGLSHQWAVHRTAELIGRPLLELRVVSCHLGSGASLAAVAGGRSVDTTMGFTPLEGLVMATRAGSVDPGLLVWLLETGRVGLAELSDALEHRSGLAGLAGTNDMRAVLSGASGGDDDATLALAVYVHRLRASIAAMVAALEGVDALVFTGGVGEHAAAVREKACAGLRWLGLELDPAANDAAHGDAVISGGSSRVDVAVVTAHEDLVMAAEARQVLGL